MSEQMLQEIPVGKIDPSPFQTRTFTRRGTDLAELADSIEKVGVLEPVLVRPKGKRFELIAGERRVRASKLAKMKTVPALVRDLDDDHAMEVTCIENLQREELHPLDEAASIDLLMKRYGDPNEVAARIGRPLSFVARRSRLTTLSEAWRNAIQQQPQPAENNGKPCRECGVDAEELAETAEGWWVEPDLCDACHADTLDGVPDLSNWGVTHLEIVARLEAADQDKFLESGLDRWRAANMTAAEVERQTESWLRKLSAAPWQCSDAELLPDAGACTACPLRASVNPGLFDDVESGAGIPAGDRCLSASCWDRKLGAHIAATLQELEAETGEEPLRLTSRYLSDNELKKRGLTEVRHNTKTSDKPKAGYKPAVWVDGNEAGHTVYVDVSGGGHRAPGGVKGAVKKTAAARLAAGQERLDRERLRRCVEIATERLEDSKPPAIAALIGLAALVGTSRNRATPGWGLQPIRSLGKDFHSANLWNVVAKIGDAEVNAVLREALWCEIVDVFKGRWHYQGSYTDVSTQWRDAQGLGELLKIDTAAIAADVEAEIPDPKSWAKLREQVKAEKAEAKKSKKRGKEAAAA